MKHYDCFRNLLTAPPARIAALAVVCCLLMVSCVKHEEYEFAGRVLWIRDCSGSYLDASAGYVVQLEYPENMGTDILNSDGDTLRNLIVLYEPTRRVYMDDHIHGKFYIDDKYSKANCSLHYTDYTLREGVFTKTVVD